MDESIYEKILRGIDETMFKPAPTPTPYESAKQVAKSVKDVARAFQEEGFSRKESLKIALDLIKNVGGKQ